MRPVATMLDRAGAGCAAFPSDLVRNADPEAVQAAIEADIGETVELVGMRHVDLDGRDVDQPINHGLTFVGFQLSPCP